MYSSTHS